jgi:hypothetical protein
MPNTQGFKFRRRKQTPIFADVHMAGSSGSMSLVRRQFGLGRIVRENTKISRHVFAIRLRERISARRFPEKFPASQTSLPEAWND